MAGAKSETDARYAAVLQTRREDLRRRALQALVCAAALAAVVGPGLSVAWLLVYAGLQSLERALTPSPIRPSRALALGLVVLDSAIFGALPLAAIAEGETASVLCGGLFLAAAALGVAPRYARSSTAFLAAVAPLAIYLIAAAGLVGAASGDLPAALAALAGSGVLLIGIARLWRSVAEAREGQRRMRAEAERRKREADAAAGAKQAFVAIVNQELRAPVSAILAGAEAIERGGGDLAARANADLIVASARSARTLLADLSDLSALETGRMRLASMTFDLPALLADATDAWTHQARRKSLSVRIEGADILPQWVRGDPGRLRQILDALVTQAVQASDQGVVTLSAIAARLQAGECREFEEKGWLVRFSLSDSGPKLAAEQRERLFAPLAPVTAGDSRAPTVNVGLTVCRELARMMGGDLYPGDTDDAARFNFEVGLADAPAVERRTLGVAGQSGDLRALVVDDHEMNRRALALMLEPFGVRLTSASSAVAALEILAATEFDVVIMDVEMPLMDGPEACQRLRRAPGVNRWTPVIACMSSPEAADWEACRKAGMNAHVAKPIDAQALHAAIHEALRAPRPDQATAAA